MAHGAEHLAVNTIDGNRGEADSVATTAHPLLQTTSTCNMLVDVVRRRKPRAVTPGQPEGARLPTMNDHSLNFFTPITAKGFDVGGAVELFANPHGRRASLDRTSRRSVGR
jgi:hypothetical protein